LWRWGDGTKPDSYKKIQGVNCDPTLVADAIFSFLTNDVKVKGLIEKYHQEQLIKSNR
jgi:hypothetical protein